MDNRPDSVDDTGDNGVSLARRRWSTYRRGMTPAKSNVSNEPDVMSPGEVCRLLHISRSTLPAWRSTGQLRGTQTAGGHWRYFADSPAIVHMRAAAALRPADVVPVGQLTLDGDQ